MARIRTIKPEFWTDDLLGALTREARLLFIATWNLADDEGLLRWSAPFLKGAVFPFDDDISVKAVEKLMAEIASANVIFPYVGGRSQQGLAYVVNFHKHQKINRPSPSRLPPPPLQDPKVREMYAHRDRWVCHLCLGKVDENWSQQYENDFCASPDHFVPVAKGGSDFPSNIKTSHLTCNKGRRDRTPEEYRETFKSGKTAAQQRNPERFTDLFNEQPVSDSRMEREREQEGKGKGKGTKDRTCAPPPALALVSDQDNPIVISFPTNKAGKPHNVFQSHFDQFQQLYPAVDVAQELRAMAGWLISNPKNVKTDSGTPRFINSWLSKAQNRSKPNGNGKPSKNDNWLAGAAALVAELRAAEGE